MYKCMPSRLLPERERERERERADFCAMSHYFVVSLGWFPLRLYVFWDRIRHLILNFPGRPYDIFETVHLLK